MQYNIAYNIMCECYMTFTFQTWGKKRYLHQSASCWDNEQLSQSGQVANKNFVESCHI